MLKELETLGKDLYGAKLIAQKCQVRNCPHFKNAVSGSECLLSMVEDGNPHHYFLATQVTRFKTRVNFNHLCLYFMWSYLSLEEIRWIKHNGFLLHY